METETRRFQSYGPQLDSACTARSPTMRPPLRAACASSGLASITAAMASAAAVALHHGCFCRDCDASEADVAEVARISFPSASLLAKIVKRGSKTPAPRLSTAASSSRFDEADEGEGRVA
jgi:hypothetical protein